MKRLILPVLMVLASLTLLGCGQSEFKVDGEFTAYSVSDSGNKPQVTTVTVTIENGRIVAYFIDVRQGFRTETIDDQGTIVTDDDIVTYTFGWNPQTKKELGFAYKMQYTSYVNSLASNITPTLEGYENWLETNNRHEWFQQANHLETFWLEQGVEQTEIDVEGEILNVAGVTISNSQYVELALEAIELARLGRFQSIECAGTDLYIASMTVSSNGDIMDLSLDVLQAEKCPEEGTFVWREHTKQNLGYNYKMHYNGYLATVEDESSATLEGYQAWLQDTNRLEWFEQVNLISDYILENGWSLDLQPVNGRGISLDGATPIDGTASVTISTSTYYLVLSKLFHSLGD